MITNSKVQNVSISKIIPNKNQPRKDFSEESLKKLAESIRQHGLIQPVALKKNKTGGSYEIIAGERRIRASEMAGLKEIPAIISEVEESQSAVIALVENIQREDLNFLEEAEAYKKMIDNFGMTQSQLAQKLSKSQSSIANKLRLLKLSDEIRETLIKENLSERHGRALLKLTPAERRKQVLEKIVKKKLSVKETEKTIEKLMEKVENKRNFSLKSVINYRIYVNTVKKAFKDISATGVKAQYSQNENNDFVEIIIRIPKGK